MQDCVNSEEIFWKELFQNKCGSLNNIKLHFQYQYVILYLLYGYCNMELNSSTTWFPLGDKILPKEFLEIIWKRNVCQNPPYYTSYAFMITISPQ